MASSVLMIYEGAESDDALDNHPRMDVRLIDFDHTVRRARSPSSLCCFNYHVPCCRKFWMMIVMMKKTRNQLTPQAFGGECAISLACCAKWATLFKLATAPVISLLTASNVAKSTSPVSLLHLPSRLISFS